jgi:transcriptional regulator of acetoin/glycerol metabolism
VGQLRKVYDFKQIQKTKERFFSGEDIQPTLHPELIGSWKRSLNAGISPGHVKTVSLVSEDEIDQSLMNLLRAPLNKFSDTLTNTSVAILLADPNGAIVGRWCSDHSILTTLDKIGTISSASLAEDAVGTNGVGTILKLQKSFLVQGSEHIADFYSGSACAGAPIWHPITGKLLGVMTLTTAVGPQSALLLPLLKSFIIQLEEHVLNVSDLKTRSTFSSFLNLNQVFSGPIVAFGPHDMRIQNDKADRLTAADMNLLRKVCIDGKGNTSIPLRLSFGETIVQVNEIQRGYPLATIVEQVNTKRFTERSVVEEKKVKNLVGNASSWLSVLKQIENHRKTAKPVIVSGELGVGKLSAILGHPARLGASNDRRVIDSANMHIVGLGDWLQKVSKALESNDLVIVQGVETLTPGGADGLGSLIEEFHGKSNIFLTHSSENQKTSEQFAIRYGLNSIWIPPLRDRIVDVSVFWQFFAETEMRIDSLNNSLKLSEEAFRLVRSHRWPGNLKELKSVVSGLILGGKSGLIAASDLPATMNRTNNLSMIDRVEADAIRQALEQANGNRQMAADILGLSRATVYRKMRSYRIS